MLSWHASNQSSPVQNTLVELGSKFLWCTECGLASLALTHLQYSPGNRPPRCLFLGVVTVAERVSKRTASQLALYASQGTLCFQPPALNLALLMSIHLMLVWLPVHLICSYLAVHCTNCWEQWKSCLCFLNKLLLSASFSLPADMSCLLILSFYTSVCDVSLILLPLLSPSGLVSLPVCRCPHCPRLVPLPAPLRCQRQGCCIVTAAPLLH